MNSANALMAEGIELQTIAAVVIGGTNLFGGQGTIFGTFIGAILMGMLANGLNLLLTLTLQLAEARIKSIFFK